MKVYRIEIGSIWESAKESHDVSARNFGEAMRKAKQFKKRSLLYGHRHISSIIETVAVLK